MPKVYFYPHLCAYNQNRGNTFSADSEPPRTIKKKKFKDTRIHVGCGSTTFGHRRPIARIPVSESGAFENIPVLVTITRDHTHFSPASHLFPFRAARRRSGDDRRLTRRLCYFITAPLSVCWTHVQVVGANDAYF